MRGFILKGKINEFSNDDYDDKILLVFMNNFNKLLLTKKSLLLALVEHCDVEKACISLILMSFEIKSMC